MAIDTTGREVEELTEFVHPTLVGEIPIFEHLIENKHGQITDDIGCEVRGISEVRRSFRHFLTIMAMKVMEGAPPGVRISSGNIVDFHFHLNET